MLANIFAVVTAVAALVFIIYGFAPAPVGVVGEHGIEHKPCPLEAKDFFPLAFLIVIYAGVAFAGLGVTRAPQSFYRFEAGESVVLELEGGERELGEILWYSGIGRGEYLAELSRDGKAWTEQGTWQQSNAEQLKWHCETHALPSAAYLRITASRSGTYLGEVTLRSPSGELLPFARRGLLTDEGDAAPWKSDFLNSTYFDEVYHVRTAFEYILGENIYEVSHPPLGKGIISLGMRLFGVTPFGWRFMGVLAGIMMSALMYVFVKNLFGRTSVAICAATVFSFDFMHYVQTRIATVDSFSVFFILLMFWFMYRWFVLPLDAPPGRSVPWLALAGLSFGFGAACKWTVVYGGFALAAMWLLRLILLGTEYPKKALKNVAAYIALGVAFFIVIPAAVYILSYEPYCRAWDTPLFSKTFFTNVWENQKNMFSYHSKLDATHAYQSEWWEWIFDLRPILYFLEKTGENSRSLFAAFGNPLLWWAGLGCLVSLVCTAVKKRDILAGIIVFGWFSELAPWLLITRCTFIYHYFPSTLFLTLAVAYQMNGICVSAEKNETKRLEQRARLHGRQSIAARNVRLCPAPVIAFTVGCLVMFLLFFPALSGFAAPKTYLDTLLRWFGGRYPF